MIPKPILWILGAMAAALAVAGAWRAWPDTIDDAHITFRYAENWAAGYGLVFNPGEPRVEGYSNPLLLGVMAAAARMGWPSLEAAARVLGLAGFIACVAGAAGLARILSKRLAPREEGGSKCDGVTSAEMEEGRKEREKSGERGGGANGAGWNGASWLAAVVTLGHFPLLYYSITGLETGMFAGLVALGIWRYYAAGGRVDALGAALWAAAALSRPEGILYPALLGGVEAWKWRREKKAGEDLPREDRSGANLPDANLPSRMRSLAWLVGVAAAFGGFLLWRHAYFGEWMPNTFTAKAPGTGALTPENAGAWASIQYLGGFLSQFCVVLPCLTMVPLFFGRSSAKSGQRGAAWDLAPLYAIVAAGLIFGLYSGGDWMPAGRYYMPIVAPVAALGVLGLTRALEGMAAANMSVGIRRLVATLVVFGTLTGPAYWLWEFVELREMYPYHVMNSRTCAEAARAMRREFGEGRSIVDHRIGALGRFSGMRVIDLFGLVDKEIAQIVRRNPQYHPNIRRGDDIPELRAVLAWRKPDLVLLLSKRSAVEMRLISLYGFQFEYRRTYPLGRDQYWLLYERTP